MIFKKENKINCMKFNSKGKLIDDTFFETKYKNVFSEELAKQVGLTFFKYENVHSLYYALTEHTLIIYTYDRGYLDNVVTISREWLTKNKHILDDLKVHDIPKFKSAKEFEAYKLPSDILDTLIWSKAKSAKYTNLKELVDTLDETKLQDIHDVRLVHKSDNSATFVYKEKHPVGTEAYIRFDVVDYDNGNNAYSGMLFTGQLEELYKLVNTETV